MQLEKGIQDHVQKEIANLKKEISTGITQIQKEAQDNKVKINIKQDQQEKRISHQEVQDQALEKTNYRTEVLEIQN